MLPMLLLLPLLMVLLFAPVLYGDQLNCYAESGFHTEKLSLQTKECAMKESFDHIECHLFAAPEVRLGGAYRFLGCFAIEVDGGLLLEAASAHRFAGCYREEIGSRAFVAHSRRGKYSGGDYSLAAAYQLKLCQNIYATTLFGYAEQRRHLRLSPGAFATRIDAVSDPQVVVVDDFNYRIHWQGPWVGLRLTFGCGEGLSLLVDGEYHRTLVHGRGSWHVNELLSDGFTFDSRSQLQQKGIASGFKVNVALSKVLNCKWKMALHAYYARLMRRHGHDECHNHQHVYTPAGSQICHSNFQHEARYRIQWHTFALLGGLDYEF
jgi:hypothetical protein